MRGTMRSCRRCLPAVFLLGALLAGSPAAAQTRFRGAPLPECRSFFLTEASAGFVYGENAHVTADLGYMRNLDQGSAVGGSVFLSAETVIEDNWVAFGVRPRYRRWLSRKTSLDATLALGSYQNTADSEDDGFLANAALTFGAWDLVGITVGIAFASSGDDSGVHPLLGIRFGSWIGSGLMAAGLVSGVAGGL